MPVQPTMPIANMIMKIERSSKRAMIVRIRKRPGTERMISIKRMISRSVVPPT